MVDGYGKNGVCLKDWVRAAILGAKVEGYWLLAESYWRFSYI